MLCLSKKMKMIMVAASFMTFTAGTAMVYAAPPPPDEPPAHHEAPPPKPKKLIMIPVTAMKRPPL